MNVEFGSQKRVPEDKYRSTIETTFQKIREKQNIIKYFYKNIDVY